MNTKTYTVYIMTNKRHTTLYTGVTGDIENRVLRHRAKIGSQFTRKYKTTKLVYMEHFGKVWEAIAREKQIKGGSRAEKIKLIESLNPEWKDLFQTATEEIEADMLKRQNQQQP